MPNTQDLKFFSLKKNRTTQLCITGDQSRTSEKHKTIAYEKITFICAKGKINNVQMNKAIGNEIQGSFVYNTVEQAQPALSVKRV